jgi:hypothetical protein
MKNLEEFLEEFRNHHLQPDNNEYVFDPELEYVITERYLDPDFQKEQMILDRKKGMVFPQDDSKVNKMEIKRLKKDFRQKQEELRKIEHEIDRREKIDFWLPIGKTAEMWERSDPI